MYYVLTATKVERYERATVAEARAKEVGGHAVSSQKDLLKLPAALLVAIYNLAANEEDSHAKPVTRFSDMEAAARRTWPVVDYLGKPGPVPSITPSAAEGGKESTVAKSTKKAPTKKATAADDDSKPGRPSAFAGKTITKLVKDNPRREGTLGHKAWGILRSGMTYEQYIAAGGERKHLAWDLEHKYVSLTK